MEANPRDRWRRKRFKENLDRLLTERGLTRKAASDAAKVDYDWLRRAVSRGIAWPDKRSMERLKKLGDKLGLYDVERLWRRHFVVPPEPSSIKDEAEKFGEEMRQYVLLVGAEDATLKGIVEQMRRAVWAARIAKKKGTATSSSPPKLGSPAVLDSPSEPTGSPSSPIRSSEILRPVNTPSTPPQPLAERLEQAKRAIAKARAAREAARGEPSSGGHSTSDRASNLPPQEPPLGVGGRPDDPTQDDSINEVDRRPAGSPIGPPRSNRADGLIAELARRVLVDFDHQYLQGFREVGLPRIEEVTLTAAEFLSHAQSEGSGLTGDDAFRLAYLPWLEKYGGLLGTTWQTADAYVQAWRYFWERRRPSVGGASPGDRPSDGMAELKGLPPNALIARHGEEWGKECDEEVRRIRAEARPLVASVLDALSPGQHDHFIGGFASRERGELYLLDELVRRIRDLGIDGDRPPPHDLDEAVRGLVAEIVEDFEKSRHEEDEEDLDSLLADPEVLVAPRRSLDHRQGDHWPTDDDQGDRRPVGTALEAEIARSVAEDREALERRVNDFWEMLGDTPLPGGVDSYRDRSEALGDRMTVGSAALRACGDDIGKALKWLTERVDRALKDEELAARRPSPPRAEEKAPPLAKRPVRKKMPVVADPEDIREAVVEAHRLGMPAGEIIADLRGRPDVPDWVRRAGDSFLRGEIGKIVARYESDREDEAAPDEFDAQADDDRRNWERDDD